MVLLTSMRCMWPMSSSLYRASTPGYTHWRGKRVSRPAGQRPPLDMRVSSMSLMTCTRASQAGDCRLHGPIQVCRQQKKRWKRRLAYGRTAFAAPEAGTEQCNASGQAASRQWP